MFCDVRGFTPLSETMTPAELVALLNGMFTALGDEILGQRGTIDKFIGDAIMAFWNAPLDQPDHARRAVLAALGMRRALQKFNAEREGVQIGLAIGLASGEVLVGNIGSRDRFNYSAIGETVNLASRIETACRHVDFDVLTTAATREAAGDIAALSAGSLALKGVSNSVETFVIVGDDTLAASTEFGILERSHADLIDAIKTGRDIAEVLAACRALAAKIAPQLDAFYQRLPQRLQDFDTDKRLDRAV
jgi:adenylate cyclase